MGFFSGIGKIFKKVGRAVKKIALPALAVAGVVATGGALLGAGPLLGAGGAAAGAAGGGGGLGGLLGGIFGGGAPLSAMAAGTSAAGAAGAGGVAAGGGGLGGLLGLAGRAIASPIGGRLIEGAAAGWSQGAAMKEQEEQAVRAEERIAANYAGSGDATAWGNSSPQASGQTRGLGDFSAPVRQPGPVPRAGLQPNGAPEIPNVARRPGLPPSEAPARPRYQYDPASGRLRYM